MSDSTAARPIRVFFSWQQDLDSAGNERLIRAALGKAGIAASKDDGLCVKVLIDEATRDLPGSPDIVDSILAKIRSADAFVADLSTSAVTGEGEARRAFCNPNVAIELGYALRELGWDRIILVFNEAHGDLRIDLPFDLRGNRITKYKADVERDSAKKLTAKSKADLSNAEGHLAKQLEDGIKLICEKEPKRPRDLELLPADKIRYERDLLLVRDATYWLHLETLEGFFYFLGFAKITVQGDALWTGFHEVVSSTRFLFYNKETERLIRDFHRAWGNCFRYSGEMHSWKENEWYSFELPMDVFQSREQAEQFEYTVATEQPMKEALSRLVAHIKDTYLEIEIDRMGENAVETIK